MPPESPDCLPRVPLAFFCAGHGASEIKGQAVASPCKRRARGQAGSLATLVLRNNLVPWKCKLAALIPTK